MKKASAILTADIHLRSDSSVCRNKDEFLQSQEKKIDFIVNLAKKHNCPILSAGDLGHKPQWKNWLLEWTINKFKDVNVIICAGQHDLPNHKLDLWDKAGIGVLHAAGAINFIQEPTWMDDVLIHPFSYGQEVTKAESGNQINIAMTHQMIIQKKDLFPGQEGYRGNQVLIDNPGYDLIVSGDNHSSFISKNKNQMLVNPGSIMRTTVAQIDYKPGVFLWYSDTNEIKKVLLPINEDTILTDHVIEKDLRSDRYDSFVQKLREDTELELSFENNMENYLKKYRTEISVKNKIFAAIDKEN